MDKMLRKVPRQERASSKLEYYGPDALSNRELLSLILRNGSKEKDAIDLADDVLSYAELNLGDLGCARVSELSEIDGIGPAKAASVVAAMELSRRLSADKRAQLRKKITDSRYIAELLYDQLQYEQREHFILFCLDARLKLIAQETIFIGCLDFAPIHPREVYSPAIKRGAAAIIVAHNHRVTVHQALMI